MPRLLPEKKVLKKLGIPDFRHMTKDKIVSFVSMLPRMDPEVAKAAIEQFPEFTGMAKEIVNQYTDIVNRVIEQDKDKHKDFIEACNIILEALREELKDKDIDRDERSRIEDKMIDVAKLIAEKDKADKSFYRDIILGVGSVFGGIIFASLAWIGLGKQQTIGIDDEEDEET